MHIKPVRSTILKKILLFFFSFFIISLKAQQRPNIIFIFIDDMGYSDLSCFGNKEMQTPNIDRIAKEGIRFTNYYDNSPICSPSRVAAITGSYPSRYHIYSYLDSREKNKQRGMVNYLDTAAPTIAKVLKQAGYTTAHFGKWHLGGGRDVDDAPLPRAYGIDECLTSFEGLGDRVLYKDHDLSQASAKLGQGKITWIDKYQESGILVDRSIDFIERNKSKPFYLELWPDDVHDPYQPDTAWRKQFSCYANNHYKQDFYAVLNNLDKQIGRLIDKLDALDLSKNTLIILCSDNGPTDWPFYYKEGYWPPSNADPFRGRKWSLYEGGIRTPFIARWPGKIKPGTINDTAIISSIDFLPTIMNIAGLSSVQMKIDGEDISAALFERSFNRKQPLYWEYGRNEYYLKPGNPRFISPNLAIRDNNWKLLMNYDSTCTELYNLKEDAAENNNLADAHPEIVKRLSSVLIEWRKSLPH
jgi:arylsulfatase A-like enzyme